MRSVPFIAALAAFCLAAMVFLAAVWATLMPHEFDRRVEWAQLKVEQLLPQTPHPEFIPTPLQTARSANPLPAVGSTPPPVAVETTVSIPGATPAITLAPTRATPSRTAVATRTPARPPVIAAPTSPLPPRVTLTDFKHDYQRFNNCAPTTLSIYLSHLGRSETQYDLAPLLKGTPDDKNVSPDELVALARTYGVRATARVDGTLSELKALLAQGIPVMIENWFVPRTKDASGHYRLLTGYDDSGAASTRGVGLSVEYVGDYSATETGYFIAQDSYTGPNIKLPYAAWDLDWRVFNRTYLVLYTDAQSAAVNSIIGSAANDTTMYAQARDTAQREIAANNNDPYAWFNLGSSLTASGQYDQAASAFDKARVLKLPWRMMWYQFGPYEAYYRAGRYNEVIALANATLTNVAGLEESFYYRGLAQLALGQKDAAKDSFRRALQANPHYAAAKQALAQAGG